MAELTEPSGGRDTPTAPDDPVAVLQRWAEAGAIWRVLNRSDDGVTVTLLQCDGGEEADRFTSADPRLMQFLAARNSSED